MINIDDLVNGLGLENKITLDDVPNIDLYMDQVIQLFESKFGETKRDDEEKILTKTMINNYAKGKLFFPIKNKKYSKEHILLISLIYQLKGGLSINDIKNVLDRLNEKITKDSFQLETLYQSYLHLTESNAKIVKSEIKQQEKEANEEIGKIAESDKEYLETILLIASFVHRSNLYRRVAEKLVDELAKEREEA